MTNWGVSQRSLEFLDQDEREGYRDVFWAGLARSREFLPRLEVLFEKARVKGRLRCSICEEDPKPDVKATTGAPSLSSRT
jgi:hypothetical protein